MTNENTQIDFTVLLNKKDFVDFTFYALIYRKRPWMMKIILPLIVLLIICMAITSFTPPSENYAFGILVLCFPIFFIAIIYYSAIRTFSSNKRLLEKFHYTFDSDKVTIKGESFDSNFDPKFISKISESKKAFYLWQSSASANIIPKRCLGEKEISFFHNFKSQIKD